MEGVQSAESLAVVWHVGSEGEGPDRQTGEASWVLWMSWVFKRGALFDSAF